MTDTAHYQTRQRALWWTATYFLLVLEIFVLLTGYWRFLLIMTSFGVIDFYQPVVVNITAGGIIFGYGLLAFIVTDVLAWIAVHRRRIWSVRLLWVSFGWVAALTLVTLTTAWLWQNAVFFGIWLVLSAGKALIVQRGLKLSSPQPMALKK